MNPKIAGMSEEELEKYVADLRDSIEALHRVLEVKRYDLTRALDYLYALNPNPKGGRH